MAYQLREESGPKLTGRPSGGYSTGMKSVKGNSVDLINDFTKDRQPVTSKPPLGPEGNRRGSKGGRESADPRLRAATRTIV